MIPIFCINLERAYERKNRIIKNWITNLDFDIKFWKAYDRRDIENNKYIYNYDRNKTKKFFGRELSHGEIACSTSFCLLYEYLLKNNYNECIIIEDDVKPLVDNKFNFFDKINLGKQEFPEADIMFLHKFDHSTKKIPLIEKENFTYYQNVPWGNCCLYMNRRAIKNMYLLSKQLICSADYPQKILHKKNKVITIVVNNPLCIHTGKLTYIGNDIRFKNEVRKFVP